MLITRLNEMDGRLRTKMYTQLGENKNSRALVILGSGQGSLARVIPRR